jgi:dihydroorotate dehydrogenase electron transfer subunit
MRTGSTPKQLRCRVLEHAERAPGIHRLALDAPDIACQAEPGQFVHVLCTPSGYDPLLRRPFSVHYADPEAGKIVIVYEVRGRGTKTLSERKPGEFIDVIGPLGQGFRIPETDDGRPFLLIGGGIGVAPLYFTVRRLEERFGSDRVTFMVGARTADLILCQPEFEKHCRDYHACTDDGTAGFHGFVTGRMCECLDGESFCAPPIIYACGPTPMLEAVSKLAQEHGCDCQVSVEAKMACGVGACLSCVIKVRDGDSFKYVRSCAEGPVFNAAEVIWDE